MVMVVVKIVTAGLHRDDADRVKPSRRQRCRQIRVTTATNEKDACFDDLGN